MSDSRTEYDSASEANTTFLSEASTSFYETMNGHSTSATSPQMEGTNRVVLPTLVERTIDEHGSEIGSVTTTVLGEDFKTRYEIHAIFRDADFSKSRSIDLNQN